MTKPAPATRITRIVLDARELKTSSGRYVERLLHYLQKIDTDHTDHQYTILLKPQDLASWRPTNQNFEKLACPHREFSFAEQLGLRRQIRGLRPDLVHFTFPQQPIWYRGQTVTTIHDLTTVRFSNPDKNPVVFKLKQQIYKYVVRRAARKAARVIVPSQFVKDDVARFAGINPEKITVTYEAADKISEAAEPLPGFPKLRDQQFIMYVGRPTPHKNLERLIEAFGQLRDQHPELRLVLAGTFDANYRRIRESVQKANINRVVPNHILPKHTPSSDEADVDHVTSNRVTSNDVTSNYTTSSHILFTDFVTEGQLRWLYEHCAAYVFPSLSEGFGLPGLEAMIHGAPVVSSNATCLPEIYGEAAHYFDPLDTQAMAEAINEVLTDKQLREKLVNAGQQQIKKYSWQRLAEQTLKVYDTALDIN